MLEPKQHQQQQQGVRRRRKKKRGEWDKEWRGGGDERVRGEEGGRK